LKLQSGFEVDFTLGGHTAIELKASENVGPNDLKSLKALTEEWELKRISVSVWKLDGDKLDK
jgi:hypothetical protein